MIISEERLFFSWYDSLRGLFWCDGMITTANMSGLLTSEHRTRMNTKQYIRSSALTNIWRTDAHHNFVGETDVMFSPEKMSTFVIVASLFLVLIIGESLGQFIRVSSRSEHVGGNQTNSSKMQTVELLMPERKDNERSGGNSHHLPNDRSVNMLVTYLLASCLILALSDN